MHLIRGGKPVEIDPDAQQRRPRRWKDTRCNSRSLRIHRMISAPMTAGRIGAMIRWFMRLRPRPGLRQAVGAACHAVVAPSKGAKRHHHHHRRHPEGNHDGGQQPALRHRVGIGPPPQDRRRIDDQPPGREQKTLIA